ncbi:MAG: excinuclease ABC subunit UvrA, partial [Planctomycetota bacterium]
MNDNGSPPMIRLRGVAVHNLKQIDLDLPRRRLIALCGVSGSGKTSLALDTLYAEGQRRYIESFSAYTRQFLERLDKPEAESIAGIPPAVAVTRKNVTRSSRATVGSVTQINEHLQLLFARVGEVTCFQCGDRVERDSVDSIVAQLGKLPEMTRIMVGFISVCGLQRTSADWLGDLAALGYRRCVIGSTTAEIVSELAEQVADLEQLEVVVDRLTMRDGVSQRLSDSIETALHAGRGSVVVWAEQGNAGGSEEGGSRHSEGVGGDGVEFDGRRWRRLRFSDQFRCNRCDLEFAEPSPQLLNYNNPLGACPACEGFGNVIDVDMERVVPDRTKSLRQGAVAPWNTPAYAHELEELLALADDYGLPVDAPFDELTEEHLRIVQEGVPERQFGGLRGFFDWLERRKYKMHIRVFLSRWRTYYPCRQCNGARLKPEALAVKIAGVDLAQFSAKKIEQALRWLRDWQQASVPAKAAQVLVEQVIARLEYLRDVGVGHLSLDRPLRTLSGGEAQRVALTSVLGSNLTGMLYVLDEPSAGLHPADMPRLVNAVRALTERGNTVAVVEHEESMIRAADVVVELGPGAGEFGGRVLFQGAPEEMLRSPQSRTGEWLAGRRSDVARTERRATNQGWIRVAGAKGNNLKDVTVEFPLGVLCLVTGVSGSGKSTLVQQTLYRELGRKLGIDTEQSAPLDDLVGARQVEDVLLVDQSPIGRTPRSNPVTYVKAFDPIRALFAGTTEA